eukprot:1160142-Pelagomonas_calceolata.AAC.10
MAAACIVASSFEHAFMFEQVAAALQVLAAVTTRNSGSVCQGVLKDGHSLRDKSLLPPFAQKMCAFEVEDKQHMLTHTTGDVQ